MIKAPSKPMRERGSALLIVFVFAAFVAIMLYMEMPVAVFEAQRSKEQLLIDRGNEYARAVKLYLRKVGQYPPSLDALENTNRMRFLRKRYKDPFTGKDDWRLLHAGPNGILIDSKVNPIGNTTGAGNSPLNASNTSNKSAGNSTFGGFNSSSSNSTFSGFDAGGSGSTGTGEVVVPKIPQRPPTIAANGEGSSGAPANQDPFAAMSNTGAPVTGSAAGTTGGNTADPNAGINTPQTATNGGAAAPNANPANPQAPGANPQAPGANPALARPNVASASGSSPFGTASTSSSSGLGVVQSGGIAGVASKAEGHGIKTVNDQEDYSLWEFYYDPTKDATKALAGAVAQMAGKQPTNGSSGFSSGFGGGLSGMQNSSSNGSSQQQGTQNTNNSFGSFGNSGFGNSGFGNSGFGSSGFGNSNRPSQPPASPPSSPPQ